MSETTANQEITEDGVDSKDNPTPNDVAEKSAVNSQEESSPADNVDEVDSENSGDADSPEDDADQNDSVDSGDAQWRAKVHKVNAENKRLRQRVKAAEKGQSDARNQLFQYQAAVEVGLPLAIADRLRGENLDEMISDARSLVEMSERGYPAGLTPRDGVVRRGDDVSDDPRADLGAIGERIYRK